MLLQIFHGIFFFAMNYGCYKGAARRFDLIIEKLNKFQRSFVSSHTSIID